jgi:hypothetical protein
MNKSYDYNGTIVSKSKPQQKLRILKRTLHLNSGDRDYTKYPTNGDFVINLPRSYDNVVAVRVKGAEFPSLYNGTTPLYYKHAYGSTGATFTIDTPLGSTGLFSFYLDCDELNQADETGPTQFTVQGANGKEISSCRNGITYCARTKTWIKEIVLPKTFPQQTSSSSTTNTFAKFQIVDPLKPIIYNESSDIHNESYFTPPISKLDRLHLVLRTHDQKSTSVSSYGITGEPGFIYSSGGTFISSGLEFGLSLELDIVENAFDDFSTLETRLSERSTDFFS